MRPAANTPAKLVQLRQSETLRILDHHNGSVRHIDPNLNHCRRYKHLDFPRGKALHALVFIRRLHLPVQGFHHHTPRQFPPKPRGILRDILRLHFLTLLDHRANHISLPALTDLFGNKAESGWPVGGIHHTVFNWQPLRRKFPYQRNIQVPVENNSKGTRNRCRAHNQHMDILPFPRKVLPLLYTKAVLLIRHNQRKPVIDHLLLD